MPSGAWSAEIKFDGQRALARCVDGHARLFSRTLREITGSYPELAAAIAAAAEGTDLILDGEIVAPDPRSPTGAPSFARLQRRMHVTRPSSALITSVPAEFVAFDVLAVGADTVLHRPYLARRELLAGLGLARPGMIQVPPHWLLSEIDAEAMLDAVGQAGGEGIVLKATGSLYEPGKRSRRWLKYPIRRTLSAAVIGYVDRSGSRVLGSLILAAPGLDGELRYIGCVGTGFTRSDGEVLRAALAGIARNTNPLTTALPEKVDRVAHYSDPVFVADIAYREFSEGIVRHPAYRGIRGDLTIAQLADLPQH